MPKEMNKDELLKSYEKISASFDEFTQLIRQKVQEDTSENGAPDSHLDDYLHNSNNARSNGNEREDREKDVWDVLRERGLNPLESFPSAVIARLEDIGRAQQKLKMILDEEIFDSFGKHDPYWQDENPEFDDKLHTIRSRIACLNDNLWDLWAILRKEEE